MGLVSKHFVLLLHFVGLAHPPLYPLTTEATMCDGRPEHLYDKIQSDLCPELEMVGRE